MADGNIFEISPGSFYEADITENKGISFTSNHPVMLAQYVKSESHWPPRGDPAMLIVPPITHFGHNVTFSVFQFADEHTHFITVIADCAAFDKRFKLDDVEVNWYEEPTKNATMCYASRSVSTGPHTITHTNPMATFYVSVHGICESCDSSYAYSAKAYYSQGK